MCCKQWLMFPQMKQHLRSLQERIFWLSCDGWSSRNKISYFALLLNYVTNSTPVSWILCVQQESDHTAEHLAGETRETLKAWDVLLSEIQGLVADNTNSMPAMARELGVPFQGCAAHKLNLVIKHSIEVW